MYTRSSGGGSDTKGESWLFAAQISHKKNPICSGLHVSCCVTASKQQNKCILTRRVFMTDLFPFGSAKQTLGNQILIKCVCCVLLVQEALIQNIDRGF